MSQILDEEFLDNVSGGAGNVRYGMEDDPLYKRFSAFWENKKERDSSSGMNSRAEFLNTFKNWVSDGVPEDIAGWYKSLKA